MREVWRSFIVLVIIFCSYSALATDLQSEHPSTLRTIQYSYTLENTTSALLPVAELQVYGPVQETSSQRIVRLDCSHSFTSVQDDLGNRLLRFTFTDLPPFSSRIVIVRSQLQLFSPPEPDRTAKLQQFLRPEPFIESDHPEIIRQAEKLAQGGPMQNVRAIFDWVARNIEYGGYASSPRGALSALRNRKGDCTEYMALFVALCRAAGIPARGMGGYVTAEDTVLKPADYHNWAEFYDEGIWKVADPQKKVFVEHRQDYIAMRIISNADDNSDSGFGRFAFQGQGLSVAMN